MPELSQTTCYFAELNRGFAERSGDIQLIPFNQAQKKIYKPISILRLHFPTSQKHADDNNDNNDNFLPISPPPYRKPEEYTEKPEIYDPPTRKITLFSIH